MRQPVIVVYMSGNLYISAGVLYFDCLVCLDCLCLLALRCNMHMQLHASWAGCPCLMTAFRSACCKCTIYSTMRCSIVECRTWCTPDQPNIQCMSCLWFKAHLLSIYFHLLRSLLFIELARHCKFGTSPSITKTHPMQTQEHYMRLDRTSLGFGNAYSNLCY